jgi:AmmeMemoRadiSam system protein A
MNEPLTFAEKEILLRVARRAIENGAWGRPQEKIDLASYPPNLSAEGASFVTLTTLPENELRGCIGALEAYQPLILDVQDHALAAAFEDHRFPPLHSDELKSTHVEISRLTQPQILEYQSPQALLDALRPGVDGVILKYGFQKATFLPQVWDKIDSKENFLSQLCLKMGASFDLWKHKKMLVSTYQVDEFHE